MGLIKKFKKRILVFLIGIRDLFKDTEGGSTLEAGLLIALGIIMFMLLVSVANGIYTWIDTQINSILNLNF